ncbi:MAG TPA: hypothetical protein DEP84_10980 [Chloroflexi bacterium]|nr:hypothetical protein [Chloroflexota bacterium]
MSLTARQGHVLVKLLDLYHEVQQPVHYTQVAERLGVNRYSAYDMLKLLERKGFVRSEYQRQGDKAGPGRTSIVFVPTSKARAALRLLGGRGAVSPDNAQWEATKVQILEQLRTGDPGETLVTELLNRAVRVETESPLLYCAEMIGALLAHLQRVRASVTVGGRVSRLRALIPAGEIGLGTLAGLGLGSVLSNRPELGTLERWQSSIRRYQAMLADLGEDHVAALSDFLQEALAAAEQKTPRAAS